MALTVTLGIIFLNKSPALSQIHFKRPPNLSHLSHPDRKTHSRNGRFFTTQCLRFTPTKLQASLEEPYGASHAQFNASRGTNFDVFLSVLEFSSLAFSAVVSVYIAVRCGVQKVGGGLGLFGSMNLVWQCVVLVGLVAGAVIRQRQWRRICGVGFSRGRASYGATNLFERVQRLEEDLCGSTTIVQDLARRLEKLGIRFRVTRKALKEPIVESAALLQKTSEATRVLASQQDHLNKELGEIQNVLLAMQDQQQKQLELILAIGKAGKMWETKCVKTQHEKSSETCNSSPVDGDSNFGNKSRGKQ